MVVGRWWPTSGEPCEVDVVGLRGGRTALLGEAKWQAEPLGISALEALRQKAARTPPLAGTPIYALWSRSGVTADARRAGARAFDLKAML